MDIYLKLKHWQLFIVLVGSMAVSQFFLFSPVKFVLTNIFFGVLFCGWLWAVTLACCKALPQDLASSPKPMQVGLIYVFVYLAFSGVFFMGPSNQPPEYLIVMHLLAFAAILYALGFTAKQLIKLEQGQDVSFFSYFGSFLLFWFFPIGVWFIQPKVNQLLGVNNS